MQTPFTQVDILSELFDCKVYLKREDQQLSTFILIKAKHLRSEEPISSPSMTNRKISQPNTLQLLTAISPVPAHVLPHCTRVTFVINEVKYHIFVPLSCF